MLEMLRGLQPGFSFGGILSHIFPPKLWSQDIPQVSVSQGDAFWMLEALRESMKSVGITSPNPAVGCVLLDRTGEVLARGSTQAVGGWHAEKAAFSHILDPASLVDGSAYVTLEPCFHWGRQPPCVDLFLQSKIRRICIAGIDPDSRVQGQSVVALRAAGKEVGIDATFASEIAAWHFPFLKYQMIKRPLFIAKWAQTLDGQLADDTQMSQWISNPLSRAYGHWLRQKYDAVLVGAKTFLQDLPRLTARDCVVSEYACSVPILLDPQGSCLRVSPDVLQKIQEKTFVGHCRWMYATIKKNTEIPSWVEKDPHCYVLSLEENDLMNSFKVQLGSSEVTQFFKKPLQSILIEGGPKTLSLFLKSSLVDLIHLVIAPILTAGSLNRIQLMKTLQDPSVWQLIHAFRLGSDTVLELVRKSDS